MKKDNTSLGATYYRGNIPAVDLLNLSMNEGEEYSSSLALLLCFYLQLLRYLKFVPSQSALF